MNPKTYAKRRAKVLKSYMGDEWAWHWKKKKGLIVRHIPTGKRITIGPVEPGKL